MYRQARGITLIELLVVMAVLAILACIVLPAFRDAMARAKSGSARTAMLGSLTDSIRHAGTTGTEVVLCPGSPEHDCVDTFDWSNGWLAYADINGDRQRNGSETLVSSKPPLGSSVRLLSSTGRRRLVVQPSGGNAGSNVTFTLCDRRGASHAESLVLSNAGDLRRGRAKPAAASSCSALL